MYPDVFILPRYYSAYIDISIYKKKMAVTYLAGLYAT